jgi:protein-disulfide isomerase
MTKRKTLAILSLISITFVLVAAQSAAPKKPAAQTAVKPGNAAPSLLPSQAEVEVSLKRTFGYDPGLAWQVLEIRSSGIPGIAEILVSINKNAPNHIFLPAEGQKAIIGEIIPFGPNPYAPVRAKLKGAFGPSRGGQNPPIDIVEFSDLQCPHCKAAQPVVEKLEADFPQVRFTFQQFPLPASLHPWALKGAQYADCAGQMDKNAFWKYVDAIFENQGVIALATADDKLKELATANGMDAARIAACAASPETDARVKKSLELGETVNVNQTPTVFINGRMVPAIASIPYDNLKQLVQFEIDHAGR